jgi:N-acetylglucosaminyl-diphospho-decaprenol L-rhamnosyltransferase
VHDLAVIILNYRTPALTLQALGSLEPEADVLPAMRAVVVDNASADGSPEAIEEGIARRGWSRWASLLRSPVNAGFAAGNNAGMRAIDARHYVLLNSDAIIRAGALRGLLSVARQRPDAGIIAPRLEWPDGSPQESAFLCRSPLTEFLAAARTGILTRLLAGRHIALPLSDEPTEPHWVSFACALLRRDMIEQVGGLDEGYFMYFEDIDLCRRARRAGWKVLHAPAFRVVHLRGGTSDVKAATAERRRRPRYYYEARARYFAKFYSTPGLWGANLAWSAGRIVSYARQLLGSAPHACAFEWRDNWTRALRPLDPPSLPGPAATTPDPAKERAA